MGKLIRLVVAAVAAGTGALLGAVIAGGYESATYDCPPQPGDLCDAGMVGFGLMQFLSPSLGLICAGFGYWAWGRYRLTSQDRKKPLA
jgi:hypothetical protein